MIKLSNPGAVGKKVLIMKLKLALLCSLGLAAGNALACFTVYDRSNRVVYHAQTSPVDMTRQLHETLPRAFPGGHMVFGGGTDCPIAQTRPLAGVRAAGPSRNATMITEMRDSPISIIQKNGVVREIR